MEKAVVESAIDSAEGRSLSLAVAVGSSLPVTHD